MDAHTFKQIYDDHALFLLRSMQSCFRMSLQQAEDVVQEVFQHLWNNSPEVRDMRCYLFICAKYRYLRQQKRSARNTKAVHEFYFQSVGKEWSIDGRKLDAAISDLPEQQRRIMEYKIQGLHHHEIAERMGISSSTVNNQLTTAKKSIKRKL
jgi:RNA polymerase sigma factor (sigma-70 family)